MKKNSTFSVEIKQSKLIFDIILIITFIAIILIAFTSAWFFGGNFDIFTIILGSTITGFVFLMPICLVGSQKIKAIISDDSIEFYIKKQLVYSCNWSELEQINFHKENVYYPRFGRHPAHTDLEYVIQFVGLNIDKTIRLWYFPFSLRGQAFIIQSIKRLAGATTILKIIELPQDNEVKICNRNYEKMHHILGYIKIDPIKFELDKN